MRLLRKLIPAFLRRLDVRLQQDHPRLWSTQLHLHLWFLLLVHVLVLALGLVIRVDVESIPDPEDLFGYMVLPTLTYLAFWTYRVVLFTPERRFGIRRPYAEVGEFLVHVASVLLIITIPYNLALTGAWRIGHLVEDEQLVRDVDLLNDQAYLFINGRGHALQREPEDEGTFYARSSSTHGYYRDLHEYLDRGDPNGMRKSLNAEYEEHVNAYNELLGEGGWADSLARCQAFIERVEREGLFLFTEHGSCSPSGLGPFRTWAELQRDYVERLKAGTPPDPERAAAALATLARYAPHSVHTNAAGLIDRYEQRRPTEAYIQSAQHPIWRIWQAKTYDYEFCAELGALIAVVLTAFCFALLLSLFKNMYWQPFVIAAVTACLVPAILGILIAILDNILHFDDGSVFAHTFYVITLFILAVPFTVPRLKVYRTVRAVIVVLANVLAPFFPIITLGLLHTEWDIFGLDALQMEVYHLREQGAPDATITAMELRVDALRAYVDDVLLAALWCGLALYTFVLHTLFRRVQTRLLALPERK